MKVSIGLSYFPSVILLSRTAKLPHVNGALFLIGIAIPLRYVEPVHISIKGKMIGLTLLLLKNVSGPYKKKKKNSTISVTQTFLQLLGSIACSPANKANLFGSYFSLILLLWCVLACQIRGSRLV